MTRQAPFALAVIRKWRAPTMLKNSAVAWFSGARGKTLKAPPPQKKQFPNFTFVLHLIEYVQEQRKSINTF